MGILRRLLARQRNQREEAVPPERRASYANEMTWHDLDEDTRELARALRKNIETVLMQEIDKAVSMRSSLRAQAQGLRTLYNDHAPEVVAKALECFLYKRTHQSHHLYPKKHLAFTITMIHGTTDEARQMLVATSRYASLDYGYTDLVARLAEHIPDDIGGTYHMILTISREQDQIAVHIGMVNLAGRSVGPFREQIVPRSLLTSTERDRLGI